MSYDHELGERELLGDLCPFCEDGEQCLSYCRDLEESDDPPMNVLEDGRGAGVRSGGEAR